MKRSIPRAPRARDWGFPARDTVPVGLRLRPRHHETLDLLLSGNDEKKIARKLGLSRHTVHDYVKAIYRRFEVNSRGELLALWVVKSNVLPASRLEKPARFQC